EIACFSYDDAHDFHLDERSLRYYYPPRVGADLSKGFNTFQQLDDSADSHLDSLLQTIIDLEKRTGSECQANFITWRGLMTKIMAAPFDTFNDARTSRPILKSYIEEHHAHKLESRLAQHSQVSHPGTASQDLMSYWGTSFISSAPHLTHRSSASSSAVFSGYKFETLSLLPAPWAETSRDYIESREDLIVNNHAQYCSVVKTGIGKSRLILGGEVDAQLKTAATPLSDRDIRKYERKLLKLWIQSFLLGVPKIIVGFRSKDGILQSLEELETEKIPRMVKLKGKGSWDGNVCINFTAKFLDWKMTGLTTTITDDGGVWRIRMRNQAPVVEVFKVAERGYGDILSKEFIEWRSRPSPQSNSQAGNRATSK
ncbi:MAG: hypothetical protein Q9197_006942, partial [Variospora fuerteventurae]